jgi:integrase
MAGKRRGNGSGSIRQRANDGRWEARYTDAQGDRRSIMGSSYDEVRRKLTRATAERDRGLPTAFGERQTVEQYLRSWLDTMKPPAVRESTWINYEHYLRLHVIPALGRLPLTKLTAQHVKKLYSDKLAAGKASTSINHMAGVLHHALSDAVRLGLIPRNVAELVDPPPVATREMQVYAPDQARRFLDAAKGHPLEALFTLWITCGIRQGESLGLKWADLDLSTGSLQVKRGRSRAIKGFKDEAPKTKRGQRKIMLAPMAIESLRDHRKRQLEERVRSAGTYRDQGYIFTSETGSPLNAWVASHAYNRLIEQAGLERIRPHDLRHSAATFLLLEGVPAKVVSEMLGHASVGITLDLYSHVLPDMQRDAAAAMDRLLRPRAQES